VQVYNIENSIEIFDDSIMHDVQLDISLEDYENLILYYKQNSEKEYLQTNITIDGILIQDV
jgi:spore coat protein CotH